MKVRFPTQYMPMLVTALASAALISPGGDRNAGQPAALGDTLVLRQVLPRMPVAGTTPMRFFAWSSSAALQQRGLVIPLPNTGQWLEGAGRDDTLALGNTWLQTPPASERVGRGRSPNLLLQGLRQDASTALPGLNVEGGLGWLEEDVETLNLAASQNASMPDYGRGDSASSSRFFSSDELPESSRHALDRTVEMLLPGLDRDDVSGWSGVQRGELGDESRMRGKGVLQRAPEGAQRTDLFKDTRTETPSDRNGLLDLGHDRIFKLE